MSRGHDTEFMASLYLAEATFDAGVSMVDANACSLIGFQVDAPWTDTVESDAEDITGYEFPTSQEIVSKGNEITYSEGRARPNSLVGFTALVLGSITSTQDGALTAYEHKMTPLASGSSLPSIQVEKKKGGEQKYYRGVKGNTLKIASEAGRFLSFECGMIGSGTRADSSTTFAAKQDTEKFLKAKHAAAYLETDSDIAISATLSQAGENISTATPATISPRLRSFEINWSNSLEGEFGHGSEVYAELDPARRGGTLSAVLTFNDQTELDYYENQNEIAIELQVVDTGQGVIASTGNYYYGVTIIVPRFRITNAAKAEGGPGDRLTLTMEGTIFKDITNDEPEIIVAGYNAIDAYLA